MMTFPKMAFANACLWLAPDSAAARAMDIIPPRAMTEPPAMVTASASQPYSLTLQTQPPIRPAAFIEKMPEKPFDLHSCAAAYQNLCDQPLSLVSDVTPPEIRGMNTRQLQASILRTSFANAGEPWQIASAAQAYTTRGKPYRWEGPFALITLAGFVMTLRTKSQNPPSELGL